MLIHDRNPRNSKTIHEFFRINGVPTTARRGNEVKAYKVMIFQRVISLLDTCSISLALKSNPIKIRTILQNLAKDRLNIILLSHFYIDIRVVETLFIGLIKNYISRANIEIILISSFTSLHSESSRSAINFLSSNPLGFICENPRHILYSLLISLCYPLRPTTLFVFLFPEEDKQEFFTPLMTH